MQFRSAWFVNYQLVLNGTVTADMGRDPALPEILRLTGRSVEGVNTVADYTVIRVSSCSLPTTSTAETTESLSWPIALALVVAFVLAGTVVWRANGRKAAV